MKCTPPLIQGKKNPSLTPFGGAKKKLRSEGGGLGEGEPLDNGGVYKKEKMNFKLREEKYNFQL